MKTHSPRLWRDAICSSLVLALWACQSQAPATAPRPTRPGAPATALSPKPQPSTSVGLASPGVTPSAFPPIDPASLRTVSGGQSLLLSGAVKLLSNHGGGIVSNNGGTLLSDQGSGLIGNNGGALIGNNASSRRLLQSAAKESLLAEAEVRLWDVTGKPLAGPDGQALVAKTDAQGNYRLSATLPLGEPVVASVRLYQGGELRAMVVAPDGLASASLPIDTASSLGAAYVLDKLVQKQLGRYQKLPASEAAALQLEAESARARLGQALPSYQADEMLRLAEQLKGQDAAFGARLDRIEALLLAGQANLGEGLPADQVALSTPTGAFALPGGGGTVFELFLSRARRIGSDGKLRVILAEGSTKPLSACMVDADGQGGYWVADKGGSAIFHLDASGRWTRRVGTGEAKQGALGGAPTSVAVQRPSVVASVPGGGLLVGEFVLTSTAADGRLLHLKADGSLAEVPAPPALNGATQRVPMGAAAFADGHWVVLWRMVTPSPTLRPDGSRARIRTHAYRRSAQGIWEAQPFAELLGETVGPTMMIPDAEGAVLLAATRSHEVLRLKPDGLLQRVAGNGKPGGEGDGGLATAASLNGPAGLSRAADGSLWVADAGNGRVRRVGSDGRISSLAGALGAVQQGDALTVAMNGPGALAAEPDGGMLIAESASGLVRRLKDGQLSTFAGRGAGDDGDGGSALEARFLQPYGLARRGDGAVAVCDGEAVRVRLVGVDGLVRPYAASGERNEDTREAVAASALRLQAPAGLAWSPDGRLAIADRGARTVWEITPDGLQARRVAGNTQKPQALRFQADAQATNTALGAPAAVAYDAQGRLCIADLMLGQVLRLEGGKLSPILGMGLNAQALAGAAEPDGSATNQVALWGPCSLLFGPEGSLYVGEFGTRLVTGLGAIDGFELPPGLPEVLARVRRLHPDGRVDTLAGQGGRVLNQKDGDQTLSAPGGLALDAQGRLVIADSGLNQLKLLPKAVLGLP